MESAEWYEKEDNRTLIGLFVSAVGADYEANRGSADVYPKFDRRTVALWEEIEKRMNGPVVMGFDRDKCREEILKMVADQRGIMDGRQEPDTSWRVGIVTGLYNALNVMGKCLTKGEENGHGRRDKEPGGDAERDSRASEESKGNGQSH